MGHIEGVGQLAVSELGITHKFFPSSWSLLVKGIRSLYPMYYLPSLSCCHRYSRMSEMSVGAY